MSSSPASIIFKGRSPTFSPTISMVHFGAPPIVYAFLDECCRRGLGNGDVEGFAARFIATVHDEINFPYSTGYGIYLNPAPKDDSLEEMRKFGGEDSYGTYLVHLEVSAKSLHKPARFVARRFAGSEDFFREMTPKQVEAERKKAMKHRDYIELTSRLQRLRPFTFDGPRPAEDDDIIEKGKLINAEKQIWLLDDDLYQIGSKENGGNPLWLGRVSK